jgi:hypothetical protein
MLYKIIPNLSHKYINTYVSDYDIYAYYLGNRFDLNKVFNSPLREDKNPSFGIMQNNEGALLYHDFATGDKGNAITFVKEILKLDTYKTALERVYKDLIVKGMRTPGSILKSLKTPKKALKSDLGVKRKEFSKIDLDYWMQFGIKLNTLKLFEVDPIEYFFENDYVYWKYEDINPMYVYKVYDKMKIYRPLSIDKKNKWRGNLTKNYVFGYKQLPESGDVLIITKSLKDVMCLYELGYSAIAPPNEGVLLPVKCINDVKKRFKKIVFLYDNDYAGIKAATNAEEKFDIKHIIIPEIYKSKDITDFYMSQGKTNTTNLLRDLLI